MRRTFAKELLEQAKKDSSVWVVTADLGYGMWDQFRKELPNQFLNTGASEQSAVGICVGLALEGKKPFLYSITNFLLYRPYETIRNYINHEFIPVKLVASGRDKDYLHDGFSHHSEDARKVLQSFLNIKEYWPKEKEEIPWIVEDMANNNEPCFISLRR